jgi:hypothetical protein
VSLRERKVDVLPPGMCGFCGIDRACLLVTVMIDLASPSWLHGTRVYTLHVYRNNLMANYGVLRFCDYLASSFSGQLSLETRVGARWR